MKTWMLQLLLLFYVLFSHSAEAASVTGSAIQRVISSLKIIRFSDLNFGDAEQGSPAKTIVPGNSDTPENASFLVIGEPFQSYQIHLPGDHEVVMSTQGGGSPRTEIPVFQFTSNLRGQGILGSTGQQMLYVGASRGAIRNGQKPGLYEGTFLVSVVY